MARRTDLREEQQRESTDSWSGPGLPTMTRGAARGFAFGALVGGALGAIALVPFAFITVGDVAFLTRLVGMLAIGALGGGTAGAIYWGGRLPELEREVDDLERSGP